jgi:molybdopterin molybdotransferase
MKKFNIVSFEEAMNTVVSLIDKTPIKEYVSLFEAHNRVLFEDIKCVKNLPSFNNSALDGFAFDYKNIGKSLKIKKTIFAGDSIEPCLNDDECYKIMTGAKVPSDANTIVPFENAIRYDDLHAELPSDTKKGNALRLKGEECAIGELLLQKGEVLDASKIAYLASQGISVVPVYKKISIAIFSTGDELKEPWEKANEDEIYNVNSSSLRAVLKEFGFKADYCGVIPDNLEDSIEYFSKMKKYDAIVTSGGISMGEADFVEDALKANGFEDSFHGINIKPGKPTMFGKMDETLVASMPGNPLAAYVNAFLFLIPALKSLQGYDNVHHDLVEVVNDEELRLKNKRVNIVLGNVRDSKFIAFNNNKYGSGMITPIVQSNAIFLSSLEDSLIKSGEKIKVIFF